MIFWGELLGFDIQHVWRMLRLYAVPYIIWKGGGSKFFPVCKLFFQFYKPLLPPFIRSVSGLDILRAQWASNITYSYHWPINMKLCHFFFVLCERDEFGKVNKMFGGSCWWCGFFFYFFFLIECHLIQFHVWVHQ